MKVEIVQVGDPGRWDEIITASPYHDAYHLAAYHELAQSRGEGQAVLIYVRENHYSMAVPLLLRPVAEVGGLEGFDWLDATSAYGYAGPVVSHESLPVSLRGLFGQALSECLRELGVVTLFSRLHPFLPQHTYVEHCGEVRAVGPTVWLDLTAPEAQQWSEYRPSHRTAVSRLRRRGYSCQVDEQLLFLEKFVRAYRQTMDRVHAAPYYYFDEDYFRRLINAKSFVPKLFVCRRGDALACGGIFLLCNHFLQYHLGGTAPPYLSDAPMKLLFDEVRRWGVRAGARLLHLGGGVGSREDNLYYFKAGFSRRRATFQTWRWILDAEAVAWACRLRHIEWPSQQIDFFPPYRAQSR